MRAKQELVLAGIEVAAEVFRQRDPEVVVNRQRRDGESCAAGEVIATVEGLAVALLGAERTALNFLQRLSGIATGARRYVAAAGSRTTILDTRKTTPTLRALEKYAARAGGVTNHRFGLGDGLLIKDNHVRLAGSIAAARGRVRAPPGAGMPVEVEAQSLAEVDEALAAGADIVLVDNLSNQQTGEAIARCLGDGPARRSPGGSPWSGCRRWPIWVRRTCRSVRSRIRRRPSTSVFEMAPAS